MPERDLEHIIGSYNEGCIEFLPFQAHMPSQIGWRLNRTELTHKNYRSSQAEAEIASYQQNFGSIFF